MLRIILRTLMPKSQSQVLLTVMEQTLSPLFTEASNIVCFLSSPVQKLVGDLVSAGTVNSGNGTFTLQTTVLSEDSAVARLVQLVQVRASIHRTPRL